VRVFLVVLDDASSERPVDEGVRPVQAPMDRIAGHLRDLAEVGADEAILVVSPITEGSITALQEALAFLDG